MQVILLKTLSNLGLVGDVVDVASGYYRNYLAPRKLAFLANPKSIKEVAHQKKVIEAKTIKEKSLAQSLKEKMETALVSLTHAAGAGDKLFGSITAQEIALSLKTLGFIVDRKMLVIETPIKTVGQHTIGVKLHPQVVANVKVEVLRKDAAAGSPEAAVEEKSAKKAKGKKKSAAEADASIEVKEETVDAAKE